MAKIIAFPGKSCCLHMDEQQEKNNAANIALQLLSDLPQGRCHTARIHPIWKARTHGILMSVVLPAHGRPGLLNRCLAALTRQTLPHRQYEIIVVDSAPSSASRKVVESYLDQPGKRPCIIYLPIDSQEGAAAARNHGWHIARGTLIAFTEEDTIPCRDWLVQGMQAFDGIAQAVRGRIMTSLPEVPADHEGTARFLEYAEFASQNCFCLRRILEDLGGFDERFGATGRDNADLYFRLLQTRSAIGEAPLAVVEHPVSAAHWGTSLRQQKDRQFDALLFKKHPRLYREKINPAIPWNYHVIVIALILLVAALAWQKTWVVPLAAACWVLPSAHLCLQRLRGAEKTAANITEILLTTALLPPLAIFWRLVGTLRFRNGFL